MDTLLKNMIMVKIKQLSANELLVYSQEYGFQLNQQQAAKITDYLKTARIDPFTARGRETLLFDLEQMTNRQTAQKADQLFYRIIQAYGVSHLFE